MVAATQFLGCGIVGGRMRDFAAMGRLSGQRILAALQAFAPDVQIVPNASFTTVAWDARQLARWGIDERRVPRGSVIRFRSPSLWRDYRREMVAALGGVLVQSPLITGLLYERRQRTHAERDSRRNLAMVAHVGRRTAMATLSGSIAHELNQPLAAILFNAEAGERLIAANRATLEDLRDILRDIRRDDARAAQIIQSHRAMLQKHELQTRPVDLYGVVRDSIRMMAHDAEARHVVIETRLPGTARLVRGDQACCSRWSSTCS